MAFDSLSRLSRRQRQIMSIVYEKGKVTAAEVQRALPDPPSNSAVRTMLRILEEEGHLAHEQTGARYVYFARVSKNVARQSAMKQVLHTFFDGSVDEAVVALLDLRSDSITDEDLDRLEAAIDSARESRS